MYAPRAKFERVYVISPIKVAVIFLICLHCLCVFVTFSTSFWIKTERGHHGPLFSCEKRLISNNDLILSVKNECYMGGFTHDIILFKIPLTAMLIIMSFLSAFISITTASLSFVENTSSMRQRYWLYTIILLLFVCIIDWFILVFVPLNYHQEVYHLQWAYSVHSISTLCISLSLITAIIMHKQDDIRYIEGIAGSTIEK
ncbi:unnamed protein product [Rotaria socialis]|uniref:Uncharacterized protein n=1 Tax=Rotaria socialis TaxID=392032 RepID=A0A820TPB9_9BILA|nr:unnamed protein product [Rotaria socialis]CAF3345331.1 unnamed protein product [Rotaria socialis]CAF3481836.1 unnamed protein product [Rotaria socialis]CAF3492104.1 unnamed protein product [Rotaria socialis]CAF3725354.1 unnamed protein product [Rotaria socialis]